MQKTFFDLARLASDLEDALSAVTTLDSTPTTGKRPPSDLNPRVLGWILGDVITRSEGQGSCWAARPRLRVVLWPCPHGMRVTRNFCCAVWLSAPSIKQLILVLWQLLGTYVRLARMKMDLNHAS